MEWSERKYDTGVTKDVSRKMASVPLLTLFFPVLSNVPKRPQRLGLFSMDPCILKWSRMYCTSDIAGLSYLSRIHYILEP